MQRNNHHLANANDAILKMLNALGRRLGRRPNLADVTYSLDLESSYLLGSCKGSARRRPGSESPELPGPSVLSWRLLPPVSSTRA